MKSRAPVPRAVEHQSSRSPGNPSTRRRSPSVRTVLETWLADGKAQGFSRRTLTEREGMLQRFIWWLEHEERTNTDLDDLTPDRLRRFITYVREPHPEGRFGSANVLVRRQARPLTVYGYYRELRAFVNFCLAEGFLEDSPLRNVKAPKVPRDQVQPFTPEQIQGLLDACKRTVAPTRNTAILMVLLDTGLRVSELIGLQIRDVQNTKGEITVIGKGGKQRTVFMGTAARRALRIYLNRERRDAEDTEPVFVSQGGIKRGQALTPNGIRQMMRDLQEIAGIEGVRCSPHTARHFFAKSCASSMSLLHLQKLMGHADLTVLRRYVMLSDEDLAEAHRNASPADRLKLR